MNNYLNKILMMILDFLLEVVLPTLIVLLIGTFCVSIALLIGKVLS